MDSAADEDPARETSLLRIDEWDAWRPDILSDPAPYVPQDEAPGEVRVDQTSLFGQADAHVRAVHEAMLGIPLSKTMISCAEISLLLYDKTIPDSKNELLVRNLLTVLCLDKYRAHFQDYVYSYDRGRTQSSPYVDMEFATISPRAAGGFFHIAHNRNTRPPGARSNISTLLREILSGNHVADRHAAFSEKIPVA